MGLGKASSSATQGNPDHGGRMGVSVGWLCECPTERDLELTVDPACICIHVVSSGTGIPTPASALSLHHNE